jgi:predicted nucleic acid-binding protein
MALIGDLKGKRIYLDANIIIYIVEEPVPLSAGQLALFKAIDDGSIAAVTSELSLAECLVYPLTANDPRLASAYEQFLGNSAGLEVIPIDRERFENQLLERPISFVIPPLRSPVPLSARGAAPP